MYKQWYGLTRSPFDLSPDPEFLLRLPQTREALAGLEYAIGARKGIVVLSGEVGTGKTVLLRATLDRFAQADVHFAYVFNPRLDVLDFFEFVLTDFGIDIPSRTKAAMLLQLNRWLLEQYRLGHTSVILVDEAQECSWELLEEIRLLTNLETASQKLVQVVLVGQPELEWKLRQRNARQLRQRVALWCRTFPLDLPETSQYIRERLRIAGTEEEIFTSAAMEQIFLLSGGIPRIVNLLCEHALILSYVHQEKRVGLGAVEAVSQDLMMEPGAADEEHAYAERIKFAPSAGDADVSESEKRPVVHTPALENYTQGLRKA